MRSSGVALLALLLLAAAVHAVEEEAYDIGPLDLLRVSVLGQSEMSGEFAVESDGMVNIPFVGKIKAAEMSAKEFERKLTNLLADGYLKRPQVAVSVKEFRSQRVYVTGEVQKPGPYSLRVDRTLMGLLAELGPLGTNAGHEVIVNRPPAAPPTPHLFDLATEEVVSKGDTLPMPVPAPEVFRVNLRELQSGKPEGNLALKAGDNVLFPKAANVYVAGHVARPGPYRYEEGLTVLKVLNQAGGVTERGSEGRVKIVRFTDGKKIEQKAKPTDVLEPEDTLVVPERFF
jgi:polysaccharide export outer membrane protein